MTAREVVDRVAKDLNFYRNSGGGVTVSGGEPLSQAAFLIEILKGCRQRGMHTAVGTCGHARPATFLEVASFADLLLFDVKVIDPAEHQRMTGVSNELILANLRALAQLDASKLCVRFPVIPGCTDSEHNVRALAALLVELGIGRVELRPYHSLGLFKYTEIGRDAPPICEPSADLLDRITWIQSVMAACGIDSDTGGG
jgi:pyruvate formate lyase activating enzyme